MAGLACWDRWDETTRQRLRDETPVRALRRYEELFRRMAAEFPEVTCWIDRTDHQATRAEVRKLGHGLAGIERRLAALPQVRGLPDRLTALITSNRAALRRPMMSSTRTPPGNDSPLARTGLRRPEISSASEHPVRVRRGGMGAGRSPRRPHVLLGRLPDATSGRRGAAARAGAAGCGQVRTDPRACRPPPGERVPRAQGRVARRAGGRRRSRADRIRHQGRARRGHVVAGLRARGRRRAPGGHAGRLRRTAPGDRCQPERLPGAGRRVPAHPSREGPGARRHRHLKDGGRGSGPGAGELLRHSPGAVRRGPDRAVGHRLEQGQPGIFSRPRPAAHAPRKSARRAEAGRSAAPAVLAGPLRRRRQRAASHARGPARGRALRAPPARFRGPGGRQDPPRAAGRRARTGGGGRAAAAVGDGVRDVQPRPAVDRGRRPGRGPARTAAGLTREERRIRFPPPVDAGGRRDRRVLLHSHHPGAARPRTPQDVRVPARHLRRIPGGPPRGQGAGGHGGAAGLRRVAPPPGHPRRRLPARPAVLRRAGGPRTHGGLPGPPPDERPHGGPARDPQEAPVRAVRAGAAGQAGFGVRRLPAHPSGRDRPLRRPRREPDAARGPYGRRPGDGGPGCSGAPSRSRRTSCGAG
ncbi:hypothetical protein [Nonomuraea salmonea]|uniref:NACHT N-terminal helical domain 7-containing protein n=1 Tax=Nonomuraea salmonea TaxID=46181 RepID=UPI003CD0A9BC